MRKNSSKKIFIKNVAARALRKTSVLSFRVHHGRDIFVMNRWRSSVFFIWTRMYLYITVYPPLLFCVFSSSSSSSCFFGTLAKGEEVFAFSIKKRERREELFFSRFSSSLFSSSSGTFERDKKKRELFFFFYYLTRTNKRTRMRRWDWKVRQAEESKKTTLDWRRYFSFFVVSFCVLVFDQDVVSFREEREKREPPKKPKKKKFSLGPKKSVFLILKTLFFFFLFENASPQKKKGVTKYSGSCRKLLSLIIIGQFKFQLAS